MRIAGFCGIREGTVRRARKLLGDAVITDRRHFDHGEGFAHGVRSWRCRRARGLRRVTVPPKVMRRMQSAWQRGALGREGAWQVSHARQLPHFRQLKSDGPGFSAERRDQPF